MKTLKQAAVYYNGVSLIVRILIGLVIGAVLALAVPGAGWVAELGTLFVGALKGIAPVLVFVIVASALAQGSSKLDRRFGTVIWLYMLTTFLAAAIAAAASFLFPQTVVLAEAAQSDVVPQGLGEVMNTLLANFVANPISSIMSGNYIGILFWACLFGLAMKKIGAESTKVFLANTADAVSQIVRWIINLAPFGIMGLVYSNVSSNGLSIFTQYGKLLALLVGTMLFMALIVSPFIIFVYLRCNPYPLVFRCLKESGLTAFFTRSSAANIPVNMTLCEKLGIENTTAFLPFGRIGDVREQSFADFCVFASEALKCIPFQTVDAGRSVRRVAVVSGGGKDEVRDAYDAGADTYLTGEASHSAMIDAAEYGINMLCCGHFETENPVVPVLAGIISKHFPDIEVITLGS